MLIGSRLRFIAALFALGILSSALFADTAPRGESLNSPARRWKIIVLIPEERLSQPKIPDPAAETEVRRQLIDAGYKVIDQDQFKKLRYAEVMDRIARGGPNTTIEAIRIGRRFGADLFITGEAFSQLVSQETETTDAGTVNAFRCRARIELKGIRIDTGEMFFSQPIQRTGAPDLTEELASKQCLSDAAEALTGDLLKKLNQLSSSPYIRIELEARGMASASESEQLEAALRKIPGVNSVESGDYDAHVYSAELLLQESALNGFSSRLEGSIALKRFHLTVQSANHSRIILSHR